MKRLVPLLLLLVGCAKSPEHYVTPSNDSFTVGRLFTVDGCTVYRFSDHLEYHYFTRCESGAVTTTTSRDESCGEDCTEHVEEEIQTEDVKP